MAKDKNSKKKFGFTVIELLIIGSVMLIILALSASVFSTLYRKTDIDVFRDNIISTLKLARNKTLASEQTARYGVYFDTVSDPHRYIFFQGQNYTSRNITFDEIYILPSSLEIAEVNLNGEGKEVVFNRLEGTTFNSGVVAIKSKKSDEIRSIYIYSSGEISSQPEFVSGSGRITDSRHVHFDLGWDISGSTILRFDFINAGIVKEVSMTDYFSLEGFDWEGEFSINDTPQRFRIHTHQLIPTTILCIHRDRNYGSNNEEVYIYIVRDGTMREIAHYDNDEYATVTKGNYVLGQMEKQ